MSSPNKRIVQISDDHFMVKCTRCGGNRWQAHFTTRKECHDWFGRHVVDDYHRNFKRKAVEDSPEAVLLRQIFGKP